MAKESAKQIICDVGHAANVKVKLRALLTSEIVAVDEMTHEGLPTERSIDEQGTIISIVDYTLFANGFKLLLKLPATSANGWKCNATTHLESAPRAAPELLLRRPKVHFTLELKLQVAI